MSAAAERRFDAIVIGTGQAGPSLAARLVKAGMQVAVIERKLFGGTCVNTGCIPTKALVASAYAALLARRAADYGVTVAGDVRVDMARVKARKDGMSGRSNQGVEKWMRGRRGRGRVRRPRAVRGAATRARRTASARRPAIFINVGGRAVVPDMPGLGQTPFLTNSSMMDVDFLPRHLVIVGGSYMGLEFAQMYRRFGSAVTVVEMSDRLISREDEDVSRAVQEILEGEGVQVRVAARCLAVERRRGRCAIGVDCTSGSPESVGSHLLLAVGRGRTPTTSVSRPRESPPTSAATSAWTTSSARTCRASGRWATATGEVPSPTPPTTTTRSWLPTCWTGRAAA